MSDNYGNRGNRSNGRQGGQYGQNGQQRQNGQGRQGGQYGQGRQSSPNGQNRQGGQYSQGGQSRQSGQYGQSGQQPQKKFTVHISDEAYESEIINDSARLQRQGMERRQQSPYGQQGAQRPAQGQRGGQMSPYGDQRGAGGNAPGLQRRDYPVSRTRVVTSRSGEKYEIPEESTLPSKLLRRQRKNHKSRGCVVAVVYAAIVCSISALLAFYMIVGINDMFGLVKEEMEIVVTVPADADLDDVTKLLDENGVVEYPFFFKLYALISSPDADFKDGDFKLNAKSDYDSLLTRLQQPAIADNGVVKVVIPEGLTVEQIAEKLDYYCVCEYDKFFDTLQNYPFKHEFIKDIPTGVENRIYRLEGYLFPATYSFYINEGSVSAINKMLNAYVDNIIENMNIEDKAEDIGRTVDEVMIIASIIERETPDPEEMKNVASVFYNRLKNKSYEGIGGKLQSDATRWYPFATSTAMKESDKLTDEEKANWVSGYDTTTFAGLPPGPICCPSRNAIKAALNPNSTKYYYFFTDSEGNHYYASTYEKHLSNVATYG